MGRSLHKNKANVKFPRDIIGLRINQSNRVYTPPHLNFPMDLIVAYAPLAKQYEVISWNSTTREYDFFIVGNIEVDSARTSPPHTVLPKRQSLHGMPPGWGAHPLTLSMGRVHSTIRQMATLQIEKSNNELGKYVEHWGRAFHHVQEQRGRKATLREELLPGKSRVARSLTQTAYKRR